MVSFYNYARIASICVGFHFDILHGYFFHYDFWPNLNFPLEYQIKAVLSFDSVAEVDGLIYPSPLGEFQFCCCLNFAINEHFKKLRENFFLLKFSQKHLNFAKHFISRESPDRVL